MPKTAPHAQRVKVREKSTGNVFESDPVDARELVTHPKREHEYAPEDARLGLPEAPPAIPVLEKTNAEKLDAVHIAQLKELAKKFGVSENLKKADIVAALLPHVEAGAINLEVVVLAPKPTAQLPQVES